MSLDDKLILFEEVNRTAIPDAGIFSQSGNSERSHRTAESENYNLQ
jgi:hypothetical protein